MKLAALLIGLAAMPVIVNADETPRVLYADLAYHFVCTDAPRPEVERRIEEFLTTDGFRVLNLGKFQRKRGVHLQDTRIHAIDSERRLIEFVSLDSAPGRYSMVLNTEPPTRRSVELEKKLERFPTEVASCGVRQVNRGSNPESARPLFEATMRRVEGWFRQTSPLKTTQFGIDTPLNLSIDSDPQQQEAASPPMLVARLPLR
jgi:hypothetical protein